MNTENKEMTKTPVQDNAEFSEEVMNEILTNDNVWGFRFVTEQCRMDFIKEINIEKPMNLIQYHNWYLLTIIRSFVTKDELKRIIECITDYDGYRQ